MQLKGNCSGLSAPFIRAQIRGDPRSSWVINRFLILIRIYGLGQIYWLPKSVVTKSSSKTY